MVTFPSQTPSLVLVGLLHGAEPEPANTRDLEEIQNAHYSAAQSNWGLRPTAEGGEWPRTKPFSPGLFLGMCEEVSPRDL